MAEERDEPEAVTEAARALYAVPPEQFTATRGELAARARTAGDAAAATQIGKLRKPTVAAWLVNALVLADPTVTERLAELGDRLRAAQERLAAPALRELTTERRRLVDQLTRAAFARANRPQPPAGLRDEVSGTFDAALADPDVAARLGRLPRAERWSGFGFGPAASPQLTVVPGGRSGAGRRPATAPAEPARPARSTAQRRQQRRAVEDAGRALAAAESALADAQEREHGYRRQLEQLTRRLARLQGDLDAARDGLEAARKDLSGAKAQRRDARSALDRAERAARD